MAVTARPLSEINEQAIRVLSNEMGAADAARFISQFTTGYGDYTEERKKLFEGLTLEEVARDLWSQKAESAYPIVSPANHRRVPKSSERR